MDTVGGSKRRASIPHLRAWRIYRLKSQLQLAQAAQVGEQTVIRLEKGNEANELTLYKLARALGITIHQLLNEAPPEQTLIDSAA